MATPAHVVVHGAQAAARLRRSARPAAATCPRRACACAARASSHAEGDDAAAPDAKAFSLAGMLRRAVVSTGVAAALLAGSHGATPEATAAEFDVLSQLTPPSSYLLDDSKILKISSGSVSSRLRKLEEDTGYGIYVVTVDRLTIVPDVYDFASRILERWYPTEELGNKKAVVVIVRFGQKADLASGPAFEEAVGFDVLDSIFGSDFPALAEDGEFNKFTDGAIRRLDLVLRGQADPGPIVTSQKLAKGQAINPLAILAPLVGVPLVGFFAVRAINDALPAAPADEEEQAPPPPPPPPPSS